MPDRPGNCALSAQARFLESVSWGYRAQFRQLLAALSERGILGNDPAALADVLGPFLEGGLSVGSEFVLREYLVALTRGARRLARSPELFRRWRDLGVALARSKVYLGKAYFQLWADGGLPGSPSEADLALRWASHLLETDADLALAFLTGYCRVRQYLAPDQLDQFVENGLTVYSRSTPAGLAYFQMKLKSAEVYARTISRASLLGQLDGRIGRIFRAVAGRGIRIAPLSVLDADHLIERRSGVVCCASGLFLPGRVSSYEEPALNRAHYLAATLFAAACHRFEGFCIVHGEPGFPAASAIFGRRGFPRPAACGFLFQLAEAARLRRALSRRYPGAVGMLEEVAVAEAAVREPAGPADEATALVLGGIGTEDACGDGRRLARFAEDLSAECAGFSDVVERMGAWGPEVARHAGLLSGAGPALPAGFVPDHDFPLTLEPAPMGSAAIDRDRSDRPPGASPEAVRRPSTADAAAGGTESPESESEAEDKAEGAPAAAFFYDEWDGIQGDYYRDWCRLTEQRPEPTRHRPADGEGFRRSVEQVKRLFQRLKPDLAAREKRLPVGDRIDVDGLVRFVTMQRARLHPEDRFWIRPRLVRRDLAVALLLDVSGSTGKQSGARDVLALEKESARLLAVGLDELGDRFGIFGFTGNGRERCLFQLYKDFAEPWDDDAAGRLTAARPGASTRMGVALRHAGWKLSEVEAKSRLIVLITDGRPMDSDYETRTHYAHYDVRKACQENHREGIHTFCIALDPEGPEELEIMFADGGYLILDAVGDLPRALTTAYLRLTKS